MATAVQERVVDDLDTFTVLKSALHLLSPFVGGEEVSYPRVLSWINVGLIGPHGIRVKLAAKRVGYRWLVTRRAIHDFMQLTTKHSSMPS